VPDQSHLQELWGPAAPVLVTEFDGDLPVRARGGIRAALRPQLLVLSGEGRHRVMRPWRRAARRADVAAARLRAASCSARSRAGCGWRSAGTSYRCRDRGLVTFLVNLAGLRPDLPLVIDPAHG